MDAIVDLSPIYHWKINGFSNPIAIFSLCCQNISNYRYIVDISTIFFQKKEKDRLVDVSFFHITLVASNIWYFFNILAKYHDFFLSLVSNIGVLESFSFTILISYRYDYLLWLFLFLFVSHVLASFFLKES